MTDVETIMAMHSYKRPHASSSEYEFIEKFILPLGATRDPHDNYFIIVGDKPTTLFSSHTDSVHKTAGVQKLHFDGKTLKLHPKAMSSCLGADCAAGVWIMTEMVKAGVPGLYVFHSEEESGGWGSMNFVKTNTAYLEGSGITAAIAFDRRGTDSVITFMNGVRTCSDAFASSLADQLPGYLPDTTGSFTDTDNYRKIIPECTNISVGYSRAHSWEEKLDVRHLIWVRDQMLKFDPTKLVIKRDPKAKDEYKSYGTGYKPLYDSDTIKGLVWGQANATAKVIEKLMSYEEFKTLVDKAQEEIDAEQLQRWKPKETSTTQPVLDFEGWPDVSGSTALSTTHTPTKALKKYGEGMFGTESGVTNLGHHRRFRARVREKS